MAPLLALLALAAQAATVDTAEVQVAVCEPGESVVAKLAQPVADRSESSAYFFDTRGLDLRAAGMAASSTVKASGKEKLKVKRNYPDAGSVDAAETARWRASCEYDVHAGYEKVGCKSSDPAWAADVLGGRRLERFGPAVKRSWELEGGLSVGEVETPSGAVSAEASRRVPAAGRSQALRELTALLRRSGVAVCADQSSRYERVVDELMSGR